MTARYRDIVFTFVANEVNIHTTSHANNSDQPTAHTIDRDTTKIVPPQSIMTAALVITRMILIAIFKFNKGTPEDIVGATVAVNQVDTLIDLILLPKF